MWLKHYPELAALFERALQDRLLVFEEELVAIPDAALKDFDVVSSKGGATKRVFDPARITLTKLRVEVRRLHLRAGKPAKWGDSSTIITKSADEFDPSNLSAQELEQQIADLERKFAVVKSAA
jgi:hypothetical protein